jgi:hypothetical protein
MKRRIFTTDPAFDFSFDHIDAVQGLGFTTVVSHIDLKELKTKKHKSGRNIIDHDWFQTNLTDKAPGYQAVGLHLLPKDRSRLKLDGSIHGQHIGDRDDVNEYFVCASTQKDFDKRVLHEEGHEYETDDIVLHHYSAGGNFKEFYRRIILMLKLKFLQLQLAQLLMRKPLSKFIQDAIGHDASPSDLAPDELGCAESVSTILHSYEFGRFDIVTYTLTLYDILRKRPDYEQITIPEPNAIILSPTTMGNDKFPGHTGFVRRFENGDWVIASNNSFGTNKGKFTDNMTLKGWTKRYAKEGGFPVFFFRKKGTST